MRIAAVFTALALIIALPFALKPKEDLLAEADDQVVIVTPHNEQIRYEFSRAFGEYYRSEDRTHGSYRLENARWNQRNRAIHQERILCGF